MKYKSTNCEYSHGRIRIMSRAKRGTLRFSDAGFTIIEALVSVFVLTVGIVGCMTLANQTLRLSEVSKDRLIAVNLSQEGIEVIRNIRDTNWLAASPKTWNVDFLLAGNYEVKYDSTNSPTLCDITVAGTYCVWSEPGNNLKINSTNGYYNYASGTTTTFKRKITISYPQSYEMQIECQVYWTSRGTSKSILMTEELYDWK